MPKKINSDEPAERPVKLDVSRGEVVALVKHHLNAAKRISKFFGEQAMQIQVKSIFGNARELKTLKDICQGKVKAHSERARGLASLLKQ